MRTEQRLPREFYTRSALVVARELLGQILVTEIDGRRTSGVIVETEAYLGDGTDAASHAHRGPTPRNGPMFRAGGHVYVYFIYGMYHCFNVVTGVEGSGEAALIRAVEPLEGIDAMRLRRARSPKRDFDLTNGPGKLTIALGILPELNGSDLTADRRIWLEPRPSLGDHEIVATPRVGISKSTEYHWRWVRRT